MGNSKIGAYGVIYCATCSVTQKKYVGQTIRSYKERWLTHLSLARRNADRSAIHAAIRLYGEEKFIVEIIDTAKSAEDLNAKEKHWIQKLGTLSPHGYNLCEGGDGVGGVSPETRELMRQAKLMIADTEEFKQRCSKAGKSNAGKKKSPEHIAKATQARLAAIAVRTPEKQEEVARNAKEGHYKTANKLRGRKRSDEDKAKMSDGQMRRWERHKAAKGLT